MSTDQKEDTIPLQLSSGSISTAYCSVEDVAYLHPPAVKEQRSSGRQPWAGGSVPDNRAQTGLDWAGQLRFPSALISNEAKLILRLRPLQGGSAKRLSSRCYRKLPSVQRSMKWLWLTTGGKAHPLCVHVDPV